MDGTETPDGAGRPKRAEAIFAATLALLAEHGYDGLTVEAVARRAGVNKTTIYRWWPSKGPLLAAALSDSDLMSFTVSNTGSLHGDLLALAHEIARLLTDDAIAPVAGAILSASPRSPQIADVTHKFFATRLASEQPIFERAIERGELPATTDPGAVMDMLAGAIWFRIFLRREPITPAYVANTVDFIVHGVTTP